MNSYGKIWIVPNEKKSDDHIISQNIQSEEDYNEYLKSLCGNYIGDGLLKNQTEIPLARLVIDGHIIIKATNDEPSLSCYLPESITDEQYYWLYQNQIMLSKYKNINVYSLYSLDQDGICFRRKNGIDKIIMESRERNLVLTKGDIKC